MKNVFICLLIWLGAHAAWAQGEPAASTDATDSASNGTTATAVFAGGCFWCTEADFEKLPGVLTAESGYTGGHVVDPDYKRVSAGVTGHTEAVRVTYDPTQVSYAELVAYFWRTIDPTVKDRQFCDSGSQYRSAIFWSTPEERAVAERSLATLIASKRFNEVHTEVGELGAFYVAEEYHQDYYKRNPLRYNFYRRGCGRDDRLQELWGEDAGKLPRVD